MSWPGCAVEGGIRHHAASNTRDITQRISVGSRWPFVFPGENDMKALTWHGKSDMRCESVPDPKIEHPRDAIIKVTACAICGSDLHIFTA